VADARGAAEVVDRDRLGAVLGEAAREVAVVGVQAADVGEDDDPRPVRLGGARLVGHEPVAVGGLEDGLLRVEGAALDGGDGRTGIVVEAHRAAPPGRLLPISGEEVDEAILRRWTCAGSRAPFGHCGCGAAGGRRTWLASRRSRGPSPGAWSAASARG